MDKILLDIISGIPWGLLGSLALAAIVFAIAKKYYDNIAAYWMFQSNKDLGKNVRIIINGEKGFISEVNWKFIYIRMSGTGNELIIPITRWTTFKWEIDKNSKERLGEE